MLALAVAWVLFVPAADWLAHHDVGSAKGPPYETAVDNARGRLLTLGAGLFAAGALVFTAWNVTLYRKNLTLYGDTNKITEQGQVTDRYTKAIEQLGSDKLDVRIGGIYALERIAHDSDRDHPTVMEVLAAFIREHSGERLKKRRFSPIGARGTDRPDVGAAITVILRRNSKHDKRVVDLNHARLIRANLAGANFAGANLSFAQLTRADLAGANLAGANLWGAKLSDAKLTGADLADARFTDPRFIDKDADPQAKVPRVSLANLFTTKLDGADLTGANLTGAYLALVDLTSAQWSKESPAPEGWVCDPVSGKLSRANTEPDGSAN